MIGIECNLHNMDHIQHDSNTGKLSYMSTKSLSWYMSTVIPLSFSIQWPYLNTLCINKHLYQP